MIYCRSSNPVEYNSCIGIRSQYFSILVFVFIICLETSTCQSDKGLYGVKKLSSCFTPNTIPNKKQFMRSKLSKENHHLHRDLLTKDPKELVGGDNNNSSSISSKRLAKDEGFAEAVQLAWRSELRSIEGKDQQMPPIRSSLIYNNYFKDLSEQSNDSSSNGQVQNVEIEEMKKLPLFGTLVSRGVMDPRQIDGKISNTEQDLVPGIVLFHTGAGPSDIFMYWKADSVVSAFPEGAVVLIADLFSDEDGKAWGDGWFAGEREKLMSIGKDPNGLWCRHVLCHRIQAAIEALQNISYVDEERIGAMGWCLGGRAVSELARMHLKGVTCAVSYHGVVDDGGINVLQYEENNKMLQQGANEEERLMEVVLCNGMCDPFVTQEDLTACIDSLSSTKGVSCQLQNYENALHGFTNPAQDLNRNKAFGYNEEAAQKSWIEGIKVLRKNLKP